MKPGDDALAELEAKIQVPLPAAEPGEPEWTKEVLVNPDTTGNVIQSSAGVANVMDHGADPTNVSDSTAAFLAAIATGKLVYAPKGVYKLSSTLTVSVTGTGIVGDGQGVTYLISAVATGDVITSSADYAHFTGMSITRVSTASSGAGLRLTTGSWYYVNDLFLGSHSVGFYTSASQYGTVSNCQAVSNSSHGFQVFGAAPQFRNLLAILNGGSGFHVSGTGTMGNWTGLSTYNNSGYGIYISGMDDTRLSECFFGGDGLTEVCVDGGGAFPIIFTNVATELSTGGGGFLISKAPFGVSLVNCYAISHYNSGVVWNSTGNLKVVGGYYGSNGQGGTVGNTYGVLLLAGSATITAAEVPNGTGQTTTPIVAISGATALSVIGVRTGNGDAGINSAATTNYAAGNY